MGNWRLTGRGGRLTLALTVFLVTGLWSPWSAAQSVAAPLLNSERIAANFGSYGIEVLKSERRIRVSNLFSIDPVNGQRTTRTFALVEYPDTVPAAVTAEHEAILAGSSIGATFKAGGWTVVKTHLWFGTIQSTRPLEGLMRLSTHSSLAVHVYALVVERDGRSIPYARIAEVHHPDYLTLDQVRNIYSPEWPGGGADAVMDLLELLGREIR